MRKAGGSNPPSPTTFWDRVSINGPGQCWPWLAGKTDRGYGRIRYLGKDEKAHRAAYRLSKGEIPDGLCVRHTCDYRPCCNPAHLILGTIADNNQDCRDRGRHVAVRGERNGRAKLTPKDIGKIRLDPRKGREVAAAYGISESLVSMIRSGKRWDWA